MSSVEVPRNIDALPKTPDGFPIPWFVAFVDGVPDFRVVRPESARLAANGDRCWICGRTVLGTGTFTIGPIGAINRVTSEPPSHRRCAEYAVQVCPFLTNPDRQRRTVDMPEGHRPAVARAALEHNPGVTCLWVARYTMRLLPTGAVLFQLGEPHLHISWWREGRAATRAEVLSSMELGLPDVTARAEAEGAAAFDALQRRILDSRRLLPT